MNTAGATKNTFIGVLSREGKGWTFLEDRFLVTYLDTDGIDSLAQDFGRSPTALKSRAKLLRDSGGWDCLIRMYEAERQYSLALMIALERGIWS